MPAPRFRFAGTVLNAPDPSALAEFYERLLGWERFMDDGDWVAIRAGDEGTAIAFQTDPDVVAPTWPPVEGAPRMQVHLDFTTDDLDGAVEHAVASGARLVAAPDDVEERVLLDPVGHPFCLIASTNW